ncbi:MAG: hypothetical protein Q4G71_08720 [Pseudomonadota bacterium]|nr:hypothetical protein [Pseudomonadota bacterium]
MSHRYALVGLTPSERSLLDALFAQEGEQLRRVNRTQDAHLLLVNGDDRATIERVRAENPAALLVLVGQPPTAARHALAHLPVMRRPLSVAGAVAVLGTLDWPDGAQSAASTGFDHTFGTSTYPPSEPLPPPAAPAPPRPEAMRAPAAAASVASAVVAAGDSAPFAPTTASAPISTQPPPALAAPAARVPMSARHTWAVSEPVPVAPAIARRAMPEPPPSVPGDMWAEPPADVLVVSLRPLPEASTLPRGLRRMGCSVRVMGSVREALAEIRRGTARFVFLDHASLGDQLLPLARAVNVGRAVPGQAPYLVVVAHGGSVFDRLRARMTSCTWMSVPLNRERLIAFFARRGLTLPAVD